ncbi:copper resistance protein CopC [Halomonas sp. M5N1S17]|uniref:copper resistance CopC family protein n=1 Tax=Halomonas alkalisoli TaxID=2907158 RepID=UPI001F21BD4F|nr:copper resistance CopC family protein [Halomonas alkalisoli]MCE9663295.1 copper resistance protein CopC [Halomonas alkalisoli]
MVARKGRLAGMAVLLVLAGLSSQALWAHAHVIDKQPADGALLEQAPEQLELQFDAPIRITQFDVNGPQGQVALSESPTGPLAEQHAAVPAAALDAGDYQVVWRGIAEDGHAMSGEYRFTIQE